MKQTGAFLIICILPLLYSCGIYSFSGASIPPEAKTISIGFFENNADLVEPTLSPILTETLRDKFRTSTNLEMIDENGDLSFTGYISKYVTSPVAIQADQTAAENRLTLEIYVVFKNTYEPEKEFEKTFSQYVDYPSATNLNSIKAELFEEITERLAQDVFNESVVNW